MKIGKHRWIDGTSHVPEFCDSCRQGRAYVIEPMTRLGYPELTKHFDKVNSEIIKKLPEEEQKEWLSMGGRLV